MAFNTRVKKLTNYTYSPTDPASEDAIRIQIDDSVQEVYDNTQTALAATTGANFLGYTGSYSTIQLALAALEAGGSGTIPPDDSITLAKQNSTVKTGLLASLSTTVKTDLVSAINEVDGNVDILTSEGTTVDVTATGDILLTYANRFLNCTNAGAIVLTIQPNSTIALPLYTEIAIKLKGAGTITFAGGAGVTIESVDSALLVDTQYGTVALHQTELNVWTLVGNLS